MSPSSGNTARARNSATRPIGITGTSIGPNGDNLPEAVVLIRLLLMSVRPDEATVPRGRSSRLPTGGTALLSGPSYPAPDAALFHAIQRWLERWSSRTAPSTPPSHGQHSIGAFPAGDDATATITVGSKAWKALLVDAGCAGQRLRVISGTAVILIDRSAGQARSILRDSLAGAANADGTAIPPVDAVALSVAGLAFNRDTGQALLVGHTTQDGLEVLIDAAWIDPLGRRRADRAALEAIADTAPLAARHLLERAQAALVEQFGTRVTDDGPTRRSRWILTIRPASAAAPE